jgi:hypothetical protein
MRNQTVVFNHHCLSLVDYQSQRVVTFAMIDAVHQRKKGTAKRTWLAHRDRFIEGEDYFQLSRDVIRSDFPKGVFASKAPGGIVLTESGYLILTKPFGDELAWLIQRQLVRHYFRAVPEFPELHHVAVPALDILAQMPLAEAQHTITRAEGESFHEHGQRGSQAMTLRRKEKKKLIPVLAVVRGWSQPQLTGFDAACPPEGDE